QASLLRLCQASSDNAEPDPRADRRGDHGAGAPMIGSDESLPQLPEARPEARAAPSPEEGDRVPPQSDAEARMAAAWRRVLDLPAVAATDNFFDVGGHSVLGLQLIDEIERTFGKKLPVETIFAAQTVRDLAAAAVAGDDAAPQAWPLLQRIKKGPRRVPLFLVA